ncbi:uncharacterized protein LOC122672545 [Telopea speciosissima]|uniref:uncharacterized protein LOC122672545 n=1 Tax=Telopea speciosissima TaxID=54955 RepID=UPI001CC3346F|nr:uncharacterized protein LOC122672545 [Telopea speciosissima]
MRFSRESPDKLMKGVSPSSTMKKKNSTISGRNDRFCRSSSMGNRVDERGAIHKHGKKAAAVFQESKDVVVDYQLESPRWADESDCMWLFSDCKSPSFSFDDHISWDVCELESKDPFHDKWCSSLLSKCSDLSLSEGTHFFDGSKVSPIEESSLVLETTSNGAESVGREESKEKELVGWLLNSAGNGLKDTSFSFSGSVDSHYESSLFEGSSVSSSAWTSLSTLDDASSLTREFDQAGIQVPLLDLDREDSEWVSDKDPEFDVLYSDSPSPSYKVKRNSEVGSFQCDSFPSVQRKHEEFSHTLPSVGVSEATNQGDVNTDEPLFWPFEQKIEWNAEIAWDSFCISPPKSGRKIASCERFHTPRSTGLRLNERKMDLKEGCKRRIIFNSGSKLECKRTEGEKAIWRSNIMSARLSRSFKDSMSKILPEMKDKKEELTNEKVQIEALVKDSKFLEECSVSNEDIPIESLIGLNEFDGHEGVDAEFNKDQFLLDE